MKKVIVRFLAEWMNIVPICKKLKHRNRLWENIGGYLKDSNYEINYLQYRFLSSIYPKLFEKYEFSFYSYWSDCFSLYSQERLLDSLSRFSLIYEFHEKINYQTKHLFLWNETWITKIYSLIKNKYDSVSVLDWLLRYKQSSGWVPSSVYHYLNTLFFISQSESVEILDIERGILKAKLIPEVWLRTWERTDRKIVFNGLTLRNIRLFFDQLSGKKYDALYFVTKDKKGNATTIELLKNIFLWHSNTGVNIATCKPHDYLNPNLSLNSLFFVFEDSKFFYDRLSYSHFSWILLLNPAVEDS
jgi:hypothetical protein